MKRKSICFFETFDFYTFKNYTFESICTCTRWVYVGVGKYTLSSTAHIPLYNIHYTVSPCLVQLCIVRNFFKSHYLFKSSPISRRAILTIFKWSQVLSTEIRFQFGFCCLLTFLNFFFSFGPLNYFSSAYFELTLLTCPVCFFTHF